MTWSPCPPERTDVHYWLGRVAFVILVSGRSVQEGWPGLAMVWSSQIQRGSKDGTVA